VTTTRSRWLLCRTRRPAAMRLYCFPHSGGSAGEYVRWTDRLPGVELCAWQLPGRGSRLEEPPLTTMPELVDALVDEIDTSRPYAFFGHSLGALVAYETALELRRRGAPGPQRLCLSAYGAPHLHRPGPPVHLLSGPELIAAIEREYGPLPAELRQDPELYDLILTGLRADLAIAAAYRPRREEPLACPLTVLGGADDEETPQRLAAWSRYSAASTDLRLFAGDHFYFREHPDEFHAHLAGTLAATSTERPAPAVPRPGSVGSPAALPRAARRRPARR
jgi:surfactin synthase thioesterase subunit